MVHARIRSRLCAAQNEGRRRAALGSASQVSQVPLLEPDDDMEKSQLEFVTGDIEPSRLLVRCYFSRSSRPVLLRGLELCALNWILSYALKVFYHIFMI